MALSKGAKIGIVLGGVAALAAIVGVVGYKKGWFGSHADENYASQIPTVTGSTPKSNSNVSVGATTKLATKVF